MSEEQKQDVAATPESSLSDSEMESVAGGVYIINPVLAQAVLEAVKAISEGDATAN